jgi:hypothetical protein
MASSINIDAYSDAPKGVTSRSHDFSSLDARLGESEMIGRRTTIFIILITALTLADHGPSSAGSAGDINAGVNATLDRFYRQIPGARELGTRAAAILVFPTIVKAGFGFGGEYGEGAMRIGGRTAGYYIIRVAQKERRLQARRPFQFGVDARFYAGPFAKMLG